jgi:hypothetical protein
MVKQGIEYAGGQEQDFDAAEKGLYDSTESLAVLAPVHEGSTPNSSVPVLSLSCPAGFKPPAVPEPAAEPARPKQKISRWLLFTIWFNTYRKFFTFVTLFNLVGIIMASLGRFPYAENHLGALVLGNLLCAILMRNELFLRFLYIIAIYGLRSASPFLYHLHDGD